MRVEDLPVAVDLPDPLAAEVGAFVETEGGWQVVSADGPPTPALHLVSEPVVGLPCVVVVPGPQEADAVRARLLGGALDCILWPQERERLLDVPLRRQPPAAQAAGPAIFRVAGTAGGAGTSTVALATGGLLAWSGLVTVVVGDEDLLSLCGIGDWRGPTAAELAELGPQQVAAEVPALLRQVPGVPGLGVLAGSGADVEHGAGWPAEVIVVDMGTTLGTAPLTCARPDRSIRRAADGQGAVVLVGDGALDVAGAERVLGRRLAGTLPRSARVARAGLAGRVPADLPGTWLRSLRTVLATL